MLVQVFSFSEQSCDPLHADEDHGVGMQNEQILSLQGGWYGGVPKYHALLPQLQMHFSWALRQLLLQRSSSAAWGRATA